MRHQRADRERAPRVAVDARQLAVGEKARKARMPALQQVARHAACLKRRAPRSGPGDDHLAAAAEAVKALDRLRRAAHDCDVVTGETLLLDSPLEEPSLVAPDSLLDPLCEEDSLLAEAPAASLVEPSLVEPSLEDSLDVVCASVAARSAAALRSAASRLALALRAAAFARARAAEVFAVRVLLVALRLAFAESAGSCPEASCT